MDAVYGDGYCDYDGIYIGPDASDSDDEWNQMSPMGTVSNDAMVLGDEKKKSDMPESSIDTQSISHLLRDDEEKANMDIEDGVSEENMATERKKKEKRKTQEDGIESEQNDGIEIAFQVKKKKDSKSKSDV
ncbi:hypothetical protein MKW94_022038 [Papaver nudicaule]|uniref:Uncharacterized protein n=1 Tax=Papaver nudicaule TaxID=74823 RepID=A0AA41VSZ3_PAPNU|nr:hypothetical protein [Papaver nudicaule]